MSNGLDPDQARQNVGPDLGPNRLQRLSADDTCRQSYYQTAGFRNSIQDKAHMDRNNVKVMSDQSSKMNVGSK